MLKLLRVKNEGVLIPGGGRERREDTCGHGLFRESWKIKVVDFLFCFFTLVFSLPPSGYSDPGSHSRLFSPPPQYGSCLAFLSPEDFSSIFPRRPASNCAFTHARRSQQLLILFIISANKFQISPGWDSNSRTNTIILISIAASEG